MIIRSILAVAVVLLAVGRALAAPYSGSGLISVSETSWWNSYDSFSFKNGMVAYTGDAVTTAKPVTLASSGDAAFFAFSIAPSTTLTLAAALNTKDEHSGGLIVTGGGTLVLGNGSSIRGAAHAGEDGESIAWNADGTLKTGQAESVTVMGGTLRFTMDGHAIEGATAIGTGNSNASAIEVEGIDATAQSVRFGGGVYLGHGAFHAAGEPENVHQLTIANTTVWLDRLVAQFSDYRPVDAPSGDPVRGSDVRVTLDNATVVNGKNMTRLGIHRGSFDFTLKNKSVYKTDSADYTQGFEIAGGRQVVTGSVTVVDQSRLETMSFVANSVAGSKTALAVKGGSTLALGHGVAPDDTAKMRILFDNGTLTAFTRNNVSHAPIADWFTGFAPLSVGTGGITLDAENYAFLATGLTPETSGKQQTVKFTGAGTVAVANLPSSAAFSVANGSEVKVIGTGSGAAVGMAMTAGAKVRAAAEGAFNGVTFTGNGTSLIAAVENAPEESGWTNVNVVARGDGLLVLTSGADANGSHVGAAWRKEKIDTTRDFTIRFKYCNGRASTAVSGGFAAVLQNDPRGRGAIGGAGDDLGYANAISKSVAVGVRTRTPGVFFGKSGTFDAAAVAPLDVAGSFLVCEKTPLYCELSYSAVARQIRFTVAEPLGGGLLGKTVDCRIDCDLSAYCGGTSAYFGVTAGDDGNAPVTHAIGDVTVEYGRETRLPVDIGGTVSLGAKETARLEARANGAQRGYAFDTCKYVSGATIETTGTNVAFASANDAFVAFRHWNGSGIVNKTGWGTLGLIDDTAAAIDLSVTAGSIALVKTSADDDKAFVRTLTASAVPTILLDGTNVTRRYLLAENVKMAAATKLTVQRLPGAAAQTLDLGKLELLGDFTVKGDAGLTVALSGEAKAAGHSTITVDGTVLDLGVSAFDECVINIVNGGKIGVPYGVTVPVGRVLVNGEKPAVGDYTAANCDWVAGYGKVHVNSAGFLILYR